MQAVDREVNANISTLKVLATTLGIELRHVTAARGGPLAALRSRAGVLLAVLVLIGLLALSAAEFWTQIAQVLA